MDCLSWLSLGILPYGYFQFQLFQCRKSKIGWFYVSGHVDRSRDTEGVEVKEQGKDVSLFFKRGTIYKQKY